MKIQLELNESEVQYLKNQCNEINKYYNLNCSLEDLFYIILHFNKSVNVNYTKRLDHNYKEILSNRQKTNTRYRIAQCDKCASVWVHEVKYGATSNLSGEMSAYCPFCLKKASCLSSHVTLEELNEIDILRKNNENK